MQYEFTMVMDLLRKGHPDPEGKVRAIPPYILLAYPLSAVCDANLAFTALVQHHADKFIRWPLLISNEAMDVPAA